MIQATDLRIGNLVTWLDDDDNDLSFVKVLGMVGDDLWVDDTDGGQTDIGFDSVRSIPLTPDILEKCGYEILGNRWATGDDDEDGYYLDDFIKYTDKSGLVNVGFRDNWYYVVIGTYASDETAYLQPISKPFHNLHQLQNLYKALTNNELEINL